MKLFNLNLARRPAAMTVLAVGALFSGICSLALAQTPPPGDTQSIEASLPPSAEDALKLARAGMNEDLILAEIKSSGASCQLSGDQILFLNNGGVSQNVIKALLSGTAPLPNAVAGAAAGPDNSGNGGGSEAAAPATYPPAAAPATVSFDYFHDQLAPYGNWVQLPGYGWCWNPAVASDPNWRPYCDQGQWVFTDQGWFWQSAYSWGDIAFHYGRWCQDASYGWVWVPDYVWGPAWVCWRNAEFDGCCGWAPLPPGARFVAGLGLFWHDRLALDIDFGLRWDAFVFVGFDHFWDRDFHRWMYPRGRVAFFFHRSLVLNGYRMVGGRFVIDGLGRDRIARFTHRDVRVAMARDLRARDERAHVEARRVGAARLGGRPGGPARDFRAGAADYRREPERSSPGGGYGRPAAVGQRRPEPQARPAAGGRPNAPARSSKSTAPQKKDPQQR